MIVRTVSDPTTMIAAIRSEVQKLDSTLPVYDVKTLVEHLGLALLPARTAAILLGSFGLLALALAAVGIYGVTSYSVAQRTREIGIRTALGARRVDVLTMVVKQGMLLAVIGMAVGLAAALGVTRLMSSLLYGVSSTDPLTFTGIAVLLSVVALAACLIPARRAMQVDPMVALRYE
jgi:putative ABC transport system permease protein